MPAYRRGRVTRLESSQRCVERRSNDISVSWAWLRPGSENSRSFHCVAFLCVQQRVRKVRTEIGFRHKTGRSPRMTSRISAGRQMRAALASERPLQVVGAINAYSAMLAERVGYKAIYLSGAGVANASFGLPDLGHDLARRRARRRAPHHRGKRSAAACRHRHRLGRCVQHRANDQGDDSRGCGRRAHRRSGCAEALRSSTQQSNRSRPAK